MERLLPPLVLLYPVVLHLAILEERVQWGIWLFSAILALQGLASLRQPAETNWRVMLQLSVALALVLAAFRFPDVTARLIPLTIYAMLFALFTQTLSAGHKPLITRIARLMEKGELSPEAERYTRQATLAWSWFFAAMFIASFLLALLAPLTVWSFFTNILSYVLTGLMFAAEFWCRKRVLGQTDGGFWQFLLRLRKIDVTDAREANK